MRQTKEPITLKELAEQTGLSVSTVSRVLNNTPCPVPISEKTRKKIYAAAQNVHYRPNLAARNLRKKRTLTQLGILIPSGVEVQKNAFMWTLVSSMQEHRSNSRVQLTLLSYKHHHIDEFWKDSDLLAFSGMFLCMPQDKDLLFIDSHQRETIIPWLFIHRTPQHCPYVTCDEQEAATTLANHFLNAGHTNIFFFNARTDCVGRERKSAIQTACQTAGALFREISASDAKEGYQAINEIFNHSKNLPTGCITTDYNTLGVLNALREKKIRIPEDISLAAFNNLTGWTALSSMEEPTEELGVRAIQMMEAIIQGKKNISKEENIPSLFIQGSTIAPPLCCNTMHKEKGSKLRYL